MSQTLLTNATLACIDGTAGYGLRENAALLVDAGRIAWIGSTRDCPVSAATASSSAVAAAGDVEVYDCGGKLVTPGLIDCHTHLVYGGWRADEFEMRRTVRKIEESGVAIVGLVVLAGAMVGFGSPLLDVMETLAASLELVSQK